MDARSILGKFPKAILIEFMLQQHWFSFGRNGSLEADLLYIQWEIESKAACDEMEVSCAETKLHPYPDPKWQDAHKKFAQASARMTRADKLYKKMEALRGTP
jgi:hypothetical protein